MNLKTFFTKPVYWLKIRKKQEKQGLQEPARDYENPSLQQLATQQTIDEKIDFQNSKNVPAAVRKDNRHQPLEKLQEGFDELVEHLHDINEHLGRQATQQGELIGKIEQLPTIFQNFPDFADNQKYLAEQMLEQLKTDSLANQELLETVKKIPAETTRQTETLTGIEHKLSVSADADAQMAGSFNKFNETLVQLNQNTAGQADSIMQMKKTFAASDRYLKYFVSKQNKRFIWLLLATTAVCLLVIFILTGVIVYIKG